MIIFFALIYWFIGLTVCSWLIYNNGKCTVGELLAVIFLISWGWPCVFFAIIFMWIEDSNIFNKVIWEKNEQS